jgi:hypothetical protein
VTEDDSGSVKNEPEYSPCVNQTEADIEAYYRNARVGEDVAIRHTQGFTLQYVITTVEALNALKGRVYVKDFGAFYMKHGKSCYYPKGQTSLVVPTDSVKQWAAAYPRGKYGVMTFVFKGYKNLLSGG